MSSNSSRPVFAPKRSDFAPNAEFWTENDFPVAVEGEDVFVLDVEGKKVYVNSKPPCSEETGTRGPFDWDTFVNYSRKMLASWASFDEE